MNYSPLRYPGGKSKISPLIQMIIQNSNNQIETYIEPFAGGSGVALSLLFAGAVNQIVINDYDKAVYSFWRALKENPQTMLQLVHDTPLTIEEWRRQKRIYCEENKRYSVELGFAAFYLNRTNRSGILDAGPIGGYNQTGNYDITARYNKDKLIKKIERIVECRQHIVVYNKEVRSFIRNIIPKFGISTFVYFDPPYYVKGQRLYKNALLPSDHVDISDYIKNDVDCHWVITYDDVPELRDLYSDYQQRSYSLNYSVANKGKGSELIIFDCPDIIPSDQDILTNMGNFKLNMVE